LYKQETPQAVARAAVQLVVLVAPQFLVRVAVEAAATEAALYLSRAQADQAAQPVLQVQLMVVQADLAVEDMGLLLAVEAAAAELMQRTHKVWPVAAAEARLLEQAQAAAQARAVRAA
jgi:hypothetical protein